MPSESLGLLSIAYKELTIGAHMVLGWGETPGFLLPITFLIEEPESLNKKTEV